MILKNLIVLFTLIISSSGLFASEIQAIDNFETDGCSIPLKKFAQGNLNKKIKKIRFCCVKHDVDYWMGGTHKNREDADEALKVCVDTVIPPKTLFRSLGAEMKLAVRLGGAPSFVGISSIESYRWGYGYPIGRPYLKKNTVHTEVERVDIYKKLQVVKSELENPNAATVYSIQENQVNAILNYIKAVMVKLKK